MSTSYQVPGGTLALGTTYYWRVNAGNDTLTSVWSSVWNLTTLSPPPAPSLAAPADGASGIPLAPTMSWNASATTTYYRLQVSNSSGFSTLAFDDSMITITSRAINTLANSTTYYWRVSARNSVGTGNWSTVRSFVTATPPLAPVLALPANGAVGQSTIPVLSWNAAMGATLYRLQVSTSSVFTTILYEYLATTTSQQTGGLNGGTTYYWRVYASNSRLWRDRAHAYCTT